MTKLEPRNPYPVSPCMNPHSCPHGGPPWSWEMPFSLSLWASVWRKCSPSNSGYKPLVHKSSQKFVLITVLSISHRKPDSRNLKQGPGIIIFNMFPGVLMVMVNFQAWEILTQRSQNISESSPKSTLDIKMSIFQWPANTVCNWPCDLANVSYLNSLDLNFHNCHMNGLI